MVLFFRVCLSCMMRKEALKYLRLTTQRVHNDCFKKKYLPAFLTLVMLQILSNNMKRVKYFQISTFPRKCHNNLSVVFPTTK